MDMVDDKALPRGITPMIYSIIRCSVIIVVDKESSGQNSESSILTVNKGI